MSRISVSPPVRNKEVEGVKPAPENNKQDKRKTYLNIFISIPVLDIGNHGLGLAVGCTFCSFERRRFSGFGRVDLRGFQFGDSVHQSFCSDVDSFCGDGLVLRFDLGVGVEAGEGVGVRYRERERVVVRMRNRELLGARVMEWVRDQVGGIASVGECKEMGEVPSRRASSTFL